MDDSRLLLNLEAVPGIVSLSGREQDRAGVFASVAAELATNGWSDRMTITLVGFGEDLTPLAPNRLRHLDDIEALVETMEAETRQRRGALGAAGHDSVLTGRTGPPSTPVGPRTSSCSPPSRPPRTPSRSPNWPPTRAGWASGTSSARSRAICPVPPGRWRSPARASSSRRSSDSNSTRSSCRCPSSGPSSSCSPTPTPSATTTARPPPRRSSSTSASRGVPRCTRGSSARTRSSASRRRTVSAARCCTRRWRCCFCTARVCTRGCCPPRSGRAVSPTTCGTRSSSGCAPGSATTRTVRRGSAPTRPGGSSSPSPSCPTWMCCGRCTTRPRRGGAPTAVPCAGVC